MTRPISNLIAAQAVELRAAGLSWATIAARLGIDRSTARRLVGRALGTPRPPSQRGSGRPRGRPLGSRTFKLHEERAAELYRLSLVRAWRSRGWSWRRIGEAFGVTECAAAKWLR
jgi:hypothetical protein